SDCRVKKYEEWRQYGRRRVRASVGTVSGRSRPRRALTGPSVNSPHEATFSPSSSRANICPTPSRSDRRSRSSTSAFVERNN
uniref:Uncharacterized protein n=1 Tax=Plectus sambesii TaxID=2011161 RepID=A0A914WPW6_9BILA